MSFRFVQNFHSYCFSSNQNDTSRPIARRSGLVGSAIAAGTSMSMLLACAETSHGLGDNREPFRTAAGTERR